MATRNNAPWIPLQKVEELVHIEPALVILGIGLVAFLTYRILLRNVSPERHRTLQGLLRDLSFYLVLFGATFGIYTGLDHAAETSEIGETLGRIAGYVGLLTLMLGASCVVKSWRIIVFEYLFIGHMRVGVPVLLVNLSTLILSILLGAWILTEVFSIRLAPLLATSAIFSVVLGLALQDTLGQLFAGIALQFDKPYELGDWIEVQSGGQKWAGQVNEVSWRATVLIGFTDENITIPNRVMGASQILNFTTRTRPIVRALTFRLPYGTDLELARKILVDAALSVQNIRKNPMPLTVVSEATESCILLKVLYFIDNYGNHVLIADRVWTAALAGLEQAKIPIAPQKVELTGDLRA